MTYVDLPTAKKHIGMDHDDDDSLIELYIKAASGAVKNYLKSSLPFEVVRDEFGNPAIDSNDDPVLVVDSSGAFVIRSEVVSATLILIGHFYKDRDNNADGAFQQGYLPMPVTALLWPLRDPALA